MCEYKSSQKNTTQKNEFKQKNTLFYIKKHK